MVYTVFYETFVNMYGVILLMYFTKLNKVTSDVSLNVKENIREVKIRQWNILIIGLYQQETTG